jgi:ABC-type sugar transport system permease subunit
MNRRTQEALTGLLFVSPWIISTLLFIFATMVYVFYTSFTESALSQAWDIFYN